MLRALLGTVIGKVDDCLAHQFEEAVRDAVCTHGHCLFDDGITCLTVAVAGAAEPAVPFQNGLPHVSCVLASRFCKPIHRICHRVASRRGGDAAERTGCARAESPTELLAAARALLNWSVSTLFMRHGTPHEFVVLCRIACGVGCRNGGVSLGINSERCGMVCRIGIAGLCAAAEGSRR